MVSITSIILIVLVISIFYCLYRATPKLNKEKFTNDIDNKEDVIVEEDIITEEDDIVKEDVIVEEDGIVKEDVIVEEDGIVKEDVIVEEDGITEEEDKYYPAKMKGDDITFDSNRKILSDYGFKDIPKTMWKARHHTKRSIPGCIEDSYNCKNGRCPVFLKNTYASPSMNFSVGTLMPTFVYYETGRSKKCLA
jgi:hypothetical protein